MKPRPVPLLLLALLAPACGEPGADLTDAGREAAARGAAPTGLARPVSWRGIAAQRAIAALDGLHREWNAAEEALPRSRRRSLGEGALAVSDPERYLAVLDALTLEEGYMLELLYQEDRSGGYPVLYARREGDEPFESVTQLTRTRAPGREEIFEQLKSWNAGGLGGPVDGPGHPWKEWIAHVRVEGGAKGFLQLGVLRMMADQYALNWHALYESNRLMCHPVPMEVELERWVTSFYPSETRRDPRRPVARAAALALDIDPRVVEREETVEVSLVFFTEFGGFARRTMHFSKDFPHALLREEQEVLVEYRAGYSF